MNRIAKGLLYAIGGLVVVVLAAFAWGRLRPPTPEQVRALALLQGDLKPAHGSNAYPWLWFAEFDVPPDQLDAAYRENRDKVMAWARAFNGQVTELPPPPQANAPKLPRLSHDAQQALCRIGETQCLAKVRSHPDAVRAALATQARRLEREEALSHFDYVWDDMPPSPLLTIPPFTLGLGLGQNAIALDFIDGRHAQALDRVCTQITTMRRLHAHSNTLISTLILAANMQSGVRLFAQMLAEMPADAPLPASCAVAFAPVTPDDVDLCPSFQFEFAFAGSQAVLGPPEPWYRSPSFSAAMTRRMQAAGYAMACEPATTNQLLADQPVTLVSSATRADAFDLLANSAGVVLSGMTLPQFRSYLARQQDQVATLRMGALLIWLRDTPAQGMSLDQRLTQRPAWMRFGDDRHLRVTPDGRGLLLDARFQPVRRDAVAWPLPADH